MPHQWNEHEHRWGERVRVNIPVNVVAPVLPGMSGRMKNLSLSGALIETELDLRLKSVIEVTFKLPPPAQSAAVMKAQVTRKVREDVGVEWCEFAPNAVKKLLRSIALSVL